MAVEVGVAAAPRDHVVQFYVGDEDLIDRAGQHLAESLRRGDIAVVVATSEHTQAFEGFLEGAGIDVASTRAKGTLITLDAEAALSGFMVDGLPDPDGFETVVGTIVRGAARRGRAVRVFGEMVGLLWEAGNVAAAIELEGLWNHFGREVPFSLLCAYSAEEDVDAFAEVCSLHSAVVAHDAASDTRTSDRSLLLRVPLARNGGCASRYATPSRCCCPSSSSRRRPVRLAAALPWWRAWRARGAANRMATARWCGPSCGGSGALGRFRQRPAVSETGGMPALSTVAPAFVEMAHRIVWTTDCGQCPAP
jgi:MEDS: MEthanogen/methylotroph, DcmR Sensory domain